MPKLADAATAYDMRNAIADVLRNRGFAVRTYKIDESRGYQITVSLPIAPLQSSFIAELKPNGDPSLASSWTESLGNLRDSLMSCDGGRFSARSVLGDCTDALVKISRDRHGETIRDAYEKEHPQDRLAQYINPLMSFEDVLRCTRPFDELIGVQDSRLHENTFLLVADKYEMSAEHVEAMVASHEPLVPIYVLSELESNGAFLNEETGELAVSFLGYNDPEILVFDCTAEKLARAALAAVGKGLEDGLGQDAMDLLTCQNLIDSPRFGDYKASCRSVTELADRGFFSEHDSLMNASTSKNLIDIVQCETGVDMRDLTLRTFETMDKLLDTSTELRVEQPRGADELSSCYGEVSNLMEGDDRGKDTQETDSRGW